MSQSPNVLVTIGHSDKGSIPQQSYANLFTEYNLHSLGEVASDADYYNIKIRTPSTQGVSDFLIY